MTIELGGLALSPELVWLERHTEQTVLATERRTLGGKLRISTAKLQAGFPITLEASEDRGWLTKEQADTLLALASEPAAVYTLLFNGVEYSVAFRHSSGSAVELRPLIARLNQQDDDWFIGQIKLITL